MLFYVFGVCQDHHPYSFAPIEVFTAPCQPYIDLPALGILPVCPSGEVLVAGVPVLLPTFLTS